MVNVRITFNVYTTFYKSFCLSYCTLSNIGEWHHIHMDFMHENKRFILNHQWGHMPGGVASPDSKTIYKCCKH